jgi:diguanylate cyclase (GGDEF)-like protein
MLKQGKGYVMHFSNRIINTISLADNQHRQQEVNKLLLDMFSRDFDHNLHINLIENLINQYAEIYLQLDKTKNELELLSITDNLTGIFNRRKCYDVLKYEIEKNLRDNHPIGLLMFDIDHFKNVNDTYGHDEGDRVLIEVSSAVQNIIRPYDTFARWGGEEFMMILPSIDMKDLIHKAEEIRKTVETHDFNLRKPITISVGITMYQKDEKIEEITKRVDELMYYAKESGRNNVKFS